MNKDEGAAYVTGPGAARRLGVSANFWRSSIKPYIAPHDFRKPGADTAVLRWAVADLDAWAESRKLDARKSA